MDLLFKILVLLGGESSQCQTEQVIGKKEGHFITEYEVVVAALYVGMKP